MFKLFIIKVMLLSSIALNGLSQSIPIGQSQETMNFNYSTTTNEAWTIGYYKPTNYDSLTSEIIWYNHGQGGGANDGYTLLHEIADSRKALVVSPTSAWSAPWSIAGIISSGNYEIWLPTLFKEIYKHILNREGRSQINVRMLGFSAGGQCVTRYMLIRQGINDSIPIKMAISINPYFYTFCTDSLNNTFYSWPVGIGQNTSSPVYYYMGSYCPEHIKNYYNVNYTVLIGTSDTITQTSCCGIDLQGLNRYERAVNFYNFSQQNAIERGTTLQWYYAEVPNVGHDGYAMINAKASPADTMTICERYLFDIPYHEPQKFPPTADFDYFINDTTQCVEFKADCKCWWQTQPTTYTWDFGNSETTTGQNIIYNYSENGTYNVKLIASNIYGSDTIEKTIEINSFPQANFSISDSVLFTPNAIVLFSNQSTDAISYFWNFGDSLQSTETSPVHTYQDTGVYTITLISCNSFGCCDTIVKQNSIEVKNPNSINFVDANKYFHVFPNPSTVKITISTEKETIETIEIYNSIGNKSDEIFLKNNTSSYTYYNIQKLNGLYFIKVKTKENVYIGKVVFK